MLSKTIVVRSHLHSGVEGRINATGRSKGLIFCGTQNNLQQCENYAYYNVKNITFKQ